MKDTKQQSVSPWKSSKGFLKVPNEVLGQIYSEQIVNRLCGLLYLCILFHAYFAEAYLVINSKSVLCKRGEWITTYRIIEEKTRIARSCISDLLDILTKEGKITVDKYGRFTCITVCGYNKLMQTSKPEPPPVSVTEHEPIPSLYERIDAAEALN